MDIPTDSSSDLTTSISTTPSATSEWRERVKLMSKRDLSRSPLGKTQEISFGRELQKFPSSVLLSKSFPEPTNLKEIIRSLLKKKSQIKTTPEEDLLLRQLNLTIFFLAVLGIVIMVVELYVFWDYGTGFRKNYAVQIIKFINVGVTGLLLVVMFRRARVALKYQKREWKGLPKKIKFELHVLFVIRTWIKYLSVIIQPIPFVQIDKIGVFMFLRLWTAFPVIRDFHPVFTYRREIVKNTRFALTSSAKTFSSGTCIKALFYHYPMISVTTTVILSFSITAFVVYILERDYHDPSTRISYIYLSLITLTTVGYGDYAPYSSAGRAACVMTGFIGIMMTAFMINVITNYLQLSPLQKEAADWTEQRHNVKALNNLAASFIQYSWRHYIYMKNTQFSSFHAKVKANAEFRGKARKYIKKLRSLRRKMMISNLHSEDPILDKVMSIQQHISQMETQNKILNAKLDSITALLMQDQAPQPPTM